MEVTLPNIFGITGEDESSEYAAIGIIGGNAVFTGGGAGTTSTGIVFRTANGGAETEKVRITSTGDVGIGADDPKTKLHVESTTGTETRVTISQQKPMEMNRNCCKGRFRFSN